MPLYIYTGVHESFDFRMPEINGVVCFMLNRLCPDYADNQTAEIHVEVATAMVA